MAGSEACYTSYVVYFYNLFELFRIKSSKNLHTPSMFFKLNVSLVFFTILALPINLMNILCNCGNFNSTLKQLNPVRTEDSKKNNGYPMRLNDGYCVAT